MNKFKGLQGKIAKEIERLKALPEPQMQWSKKVGVIEAYEQVLVWIDELNNMEIIETRKRDGVIEAYEQVLVWIDELNNMEIIETRKRDGFMVS